MKIQHSVTKQPYFTPGNAQHGADIATSETGIKHQVIEEQDGVFAVVIDDAIQANTAPPLATVPTISLADMMAWEYVANWLIDGLIEQSVRLIVAEHTSPPYQRHLLMKTAR